MKIIDLLNMISKGEEVPKKIRIDHWSYKFEWVEHESNYYDKHEDIDLMSCLSCDKEELNYEVHEIEEENKIPEKLKSLNNVGNVPNLVEFADKQQLNNHLLKDKLNEIVHYLQYLKSKESNNERRFIKDN
jgi:hypothetical protein